MADMAAFSLEDTHSLQGPRERASVAPLAIGYASLSFFARNFLISAFVGSLERCWLFPARAVPVGLGNLARNGE